MTTWIWIWLGIIALCVVIEALTMELISCWCIVGGIVALILAICGVAVEVQWIVFGLTSVILLLAFRKLVQKFLSKNDAHTNADSEFGKTAELLTPITKHENGTIKIKGIVWTVTTSDKSEIEAGAIVKLINLEGNKYIVKKIEEDNKENK